MVESDLWHRIKKSVSKKVSMTRIENLASAGIPDVTACKDGVDAWFELKLIKAGRIEVRYSQINWFVQRLKAKSINVYLVAQDAKGGPINVWRAETIVLRSHWAKGRARTRMDDDSMTFEPGDADFVAENWSDFEDIVFGHTSENQ